MFIFQVPVGGKNGLGLYYKRCYSSTGGRKARRSETRSVEKIAVLVVAVINDVIGMADAGGCRHLAF